MRALWLILSLVLTAIVAERASAQGRPDTATMTCAQAASIVASQGAAVLGTGQYIYDRYVSSGRYCAVTESTDPAWIASRDNPQCFVGYRCRGRAQQQSGR